MIKLSRGFTLLEILIVLGIMGLLAAIIVPRINSGNDYYTMGGDVREISSALRMTRSMAINQQRDKVLQFDLQEKTYRIDGQAPRELSPQIDLDVFTAASEISDDKRFAGIRFYEDGASTGGRVTLTLGSDKRAVDVVWMTGQINVLEDVDGDD